MITRAMISKDVPNEDGTWDVFIPIFSQLPRDNSTRDLLTNGSGKRAANVQQNNYDPTINVAVDFDIDKSSKLNILQSVTGNKLSKYVHRAYLCGMLGVTYNFALGDIVFVSFENNDYTRPVIIGSLLTNQILEKRRNDSQVKFNSIQVESLVADGSAKLPDDTEIKFFINGQEFTFNSDFLSLLWGIVNKES